MIKLNLEIPKPKSDNKLQMIQPMIVVNKENYHTSLIEFKDHLNDNKCKFVIFNVEFSNVSFLTEKLNMPSECENYLKIYLQEIIEIKERHMKKFPQIVYSEFIICKERGKEKNTFKLFPFLIPSLKFHKFKERESLINLDPECLNYINFIKQITEKNNEELKKNGKEDLLKKEYSLSNICSTSTISYLNLKEREKIKINYEKILKEGKPTKKENTKSYYFFPKNIIMPTKQTKFELEEIIEDILVLLKDRRCDYDTQTQTTEEHTRIIKNNYFIVDKLLNFEWRHILNPYSRDLIRITIKNVDIKNLKMQISEDHNDVWSMFNKFCEKLCKYLFKNSDSFNNITMVNNFNFVYDPNLIDEKFFINWRNFMESFFENKVLITLNFIKSEVNFNFRFLNTQEERKEISDFTQYINRIIKLLVIDSDEEASDDEIGFSDNSIFKKNYFLQNFNFYFIFPKKIHKYFEVIYTLSIIYDISLLKNVNFSRKNLNRFEDLFLNLNNDKEILFEYEIEKELYFFLACFKKEVEKKLVESSKDNISILNEGLIKDFFIFCQNKEYLGQIEQVFKGFIRIDRIDIKKREMKFTFNSLTTDQLKNQFILDHEIEKEIRYELIKVFMKLKKEILFEEEFGLSNFFISLFNFNTGENKNQYTIVGSNLLQKLCFIYFEVFNNENKYSEEMFEEFESIINGVNYMDLNYLCKKTNHNLISEINKNSKNDLICLKYFEIFEKILFKNEKNRIADDYLNKFLITLNDSNLNNFQIINQDGNLIVEKSVVDSVSKVNNRIIIKTKNRDNLRESYNLIIEICKNYGDFMINQTQGQFELCFLSFTSVENTLLNIIEEINKLENIQIIS